MLERAHDRGADRDDPPALCLRAPDRRCGRVRDAVGLVERQASIELPVPGGGESGRVRDRVERNAANAHRRNHSPIEREAGGRRLEGDRWTGNRSPYVPQRERHRHVRVLDGPAVTCQARPDRVGRALEAQRHETRVTENPLHRGRQGSQRKAIARREPRRRRPFFGASTEVTRPEHDDGEMPDIVHRERAPAGESHFDAAARRYMLAVQARGQGGGVVGDHVIAGLEEIGQGRTGQMADASARVNH